MDIDHIKEGLLALYAVERLDAQKVSDDNRIGQLERAVRLLEPMITKSELLMNLRENALKLFQPVRRVEAMGSFIKDNFSAYDLRANFVFVDCFPNGKLPEGTDCLLINSSPSLRECDFAQNVHATFVGRWLVNAYEAQIVALHGAHVNLMDTVSTARCPVKNASAIRRQDTYYQGVLELNEVSFRELEILSRTKTAREVLEHVIADGEDPSMPLCPCLVHAAASLEKGDQLIAENDRFALVRNALHRSYSLCQKWTEGEVCSFMRCVTAEIPLSEDLRVLQSCLMRETFLRLPDEQMEIGRNYQGEPVTLSFDAKRYGFVPHNLYVQTGTCDWRAETSIIDLEPKLPLNRTIEKIKAQYRQVLQGVVVQKASHSVRR